MDNLNLARDESVMYRSQKIISSGTGYEVVLTERRFILAESGTGTIREDLPFSAIVLAAHEFNTLREPVILLTIMEPDGTRKQLELIFVHVIGDLNVQDRDRCMSALRARNVTIEGSLNQARPLSPVWRDNAGAVATGEEANVRPAVPEWTVYGTPRYTHKVPEEAPPRSSLLLIIAAALVIGLCVGGILIAGHMSEPLAVPGTVAVPGTSAGVTGNGVSSTAPIPETTSGPARKVLSATGATPADGVWVRVSYPGNFSGTVGAQGWMTAVNGSGTQLYHLPVNDTVIEGTVDKLDGSGDILEIEIYNGGALVSESTTAKPWGSIDLDTPVGPAIRNIPETTTAIPTIAAVPTLDTSLVLHEVPLSGIWMRITYPGNFTGTFYADGMARDVNSSGDQFYQIPMTHGQIDGFINKGDGSGKNMIIQIFKDGTLVTYGNTSAPLGTVEIHATM
jgi:hypothetical protein